MKTFILEMYRGVYDATVSPYSGTLMTTIYKTFDDALDYVETWLKSRTNAEISCYYDILNKGDRLKRLYILKREDGIETFFINIDWDIVI